MKLLFLGPHDSPLRHWLARREEQVISTAERLTPEFLDGHTPDFIVSYGYRHILPAALLDPYADRAINLHVSYLPWNRGADPNLWSFVENSPKGVTLHYLDAGVDTGDIVAQQRVDFRGDETLRTSYEILQRVIQALFKRQWPAIRAGRCNRTPQPPGGSVHRRRDRRAVESLLTLGWDTPVVALHSRSQVEESGEAPV